MQFLTLWTYLVGTQRFTFLTNRFKSQFLGQGLFRFDMICVSQNKKWNFQNICFQFARINEEKPFSWLIKKKPGVMWENNIKYDKCNTLTNLTIRRNLVRRDARRQKRQIFTSSHPAIQWSVVFTHKPVKRLHRVVHAGVFYASGLTGERWGWGSVLKCTLFWYVCAHSWASHPARCFLSSILALIDRAANSQHKTRIDSAGTGKLVFYSLSLPLTIPSSLANAVIQFQLCYTSP